jgi:hypothetical protein
MRWNIWNVLVSIRGSGEFFSNNIYLSNYQKETTEETDNTTVRPLLLCTVKDLIKCIDNEPAACRPPPLDFGSSNCAMYWACDRCTAVADPVKVKFWWRMAQAASGGRRFSRPSQPESKGAKNRKILRTGGQCELVRLDCLRSRYRHPVH